MTVPTRLVTRPWAGLSDLPNPRPVALADDRWTGLFWQASEILHAFSGRQFLGSCTTTVTLDAPPDGRRGLPCWTPVGERYAVTLTWPRPVRWARDGVVVVLPGPPVTSVDAVTIVGQPVGFTADLPAGRLWRSDREPWPVDGTAQVTYAHGVGPPEGGVAACVMLAVEMAKAAAGSRCALPERIKQISREGVTVGIMDTFEHLDKMQTGLLPVDMWLAAVNPGRMTRRPSVWTPDRVPTRRT